MRRTASEILRNLEIRVARLEKSARYNARLYPHPEESVYSRDIGYSTGESSYGYKRIERHYDLIIEPIANLRSLRGFYKGDELKDRDIQALKRELRKGREITCMVSPSFSPEGLTNDQLLRVEGNIKPKADLEMLHSEAERYIGDRVIVGDIGIISIDGDKGYLLW